MTIQANANGAPELTQRQRLVLILSQVWGWVFLILMILFFAVTVSIKEEINFLSIRNSQNILVAITPPLLMGLGQTFVIIAGGIDLSVGWVMGLASVVSALVIRGLADGGMAVPLAILIGFGAGLVAAMIPGFINGVIVAKLHVPPFIVTLGMSFVARGAAYLLSGGNVVGSQPSTLRDVGNEAILYYMEGRFFFFQKPEIPREQLRSLERILPWPVVVTAVVVGIAIFILHKTQFGRHTYAIGGNAEAARRAGVKVDRHVIMLYVLSGLTVGFAGILHTARFSGGSSIAGDPLMLPSIAAVVIGGVSLFGGVGRISGTVVGALIIAVLQVGLVMLNVEPFWQWIVVGIIVIVAVLIDQSRDLIVGRAAVSE